MLQVEHLKKKCKLWAPTRHRLRRAGRNVAVGPDGDPLRMHGCRVGLEVTELLLLPWWAARVQFSCPDLS